MSIEIGSKAPEFTLDSASGKLSLADFAGQKLALYFYPKDDTSGCTKEAIDFFGLVERFAATGAKVVGVSRDTVASHGKFAAKHQISVALASDTDGKTTEAYGAWVEKSMYGRKYMGIDRSTFLIDRNGMVAGVWRKVKVPGHAAAVLKAAEQLP